MPAVPTISTGAMRRSSFYGRSRTSSSGSASSSTSSHNQQLGSGSSASSAPTSSSKTSSSAKRSSSPLAKKQAAVAAAANAASKRLHNPNAIATAHKSSTIASLTAAKPSAVQRLRQEAVQSRLVLDEQEYQSEVVKHMHHMEEETVPCIDLMDAQPELRWYMRPYLVDFVVEIHQTFRLRPETLFLTMNIVDRYVSKRIVYKRHYQLVGCAALLIASKFEDAKDKVPLVSELAQMCCSAYDESAFVQMEGHVLSTVGWTLGFPTPEAWLRMACATSATATYDKEDALSTVSAADLDSKTLNMARFMLEVTLFTRDFVGMTPSNLTAGCLLLSRIVASKGADKQRLTSIASSHAIHVAQLVDTYMIEHAHELSDILIKKYSFSHFNNASNAVVQWYAAFVEQRGLAGAASPLLPAPSFTAGSTAMTKSMSASSSFSKPRRSAEDMQDDDDDDDDVSMHSRSATPSSMVSTPSQMSTDGEDEDDDDDHAHDDEDEESDMPVTPLSLNSLHDPLVATAEAAKENGASAAGKGATASKTAEQQYLQARDDRRALALSQQNNRLTVV